MQNKLNLSEIYIGKSDANNECLEYGSQIFQDLFLNEKKFSVEKFINGNLYFICGNKGTGKTAILKYIESIIVDNQGCENQKFCKYIRFRRDIDEDQKNEVKRAEKDDEIDLNDITEYKRLNCVLAWKVYIIKIILFLIDNQDKVVFLHDENWNKLIRILHALYGEKKDLILPKVKRGVIEINSEIIGTKLSLDLEWTDDKKNKATFSSVGRRIIDLFAHLKNTDGDVFVLFDEMELTLNKNKEYERDIILLRDLILAILQLNELIRLKHYNIRIIAAIRNEVCRSIKSSGTEINKSIDDWGLSISWHQKGGNTEQHPIIKMIERRIQVSERIRGISDGVDIWKKYFSPEIGKVEVRDFILNRTWYKPRDAVRLLKIAQDKFGSHQVFDQEVFDTIGQDYSQRSWEEIVEELRTKYNEVEVDGIVKILTAIEIPFTYKEVNERITKQTELHTSVERLEKNRKLADILSDLYDVGVIGNYGEYMRFSFRGDANIDLLSPFTLHYTLKKHFGAKRNIARDINHYEDEYLK